MSSAFTSPPAANLQLELLDPAGKTFVRLFRHPGAHWDPPPAEFRNLRVDPPPAHRADYAVLYTATTVATVAMECRVLNVDANDAYTYATEKARAYQVVRYVCDKPAILMPIDGRNRDLLNLGGGKRAFLGYKPYQEVAHDLFKRFGEIIHGLSWESFHRNQPGRIYALWHHHKSTVGLRIISDQPFTSLAEDAEWKAFLTDHSEIEALEPSPSDLGAPTSD